MSVEFPLTLLDCFVEAGTPGSVSYLTTAFLMAVGLFGFKRRFRAGSCCAFTLASALPAIIGVSGVHYLVMTFRDQNGHYTPGLMDRYLHSGEAFMPFMAGCSCSCVLMFVASILWMRCREELGDN